MTNHERYARTIVRTRQAQLIAEERALLAKVEKRGSVPWKDLPPRVQTIVRRLRSIDREEKQLKKELTRRGFATYNVQVAKALAVDSTAHNRKQELFRAVFRRRQDKLTELYNVAVVDLLGRDAPSAKTILTALAQNVRTV